MLRAAGVFPAFWKNWIPASSTAARRWRDWDAYQRQLKRFDIKVKGALSDVVEKFFHTTESAVLFPEFVARAVRQGMEEENLLPHITAAVTQFDGMDYRSIASVPTKEDKALRVVAEGARAAGNHGEGPEQRCGCTKRGRMLVAS